MDMLNALAPMAAVLIFLLMFILIILDRWPHHRVTLCCGLATLLLVFGVMMDDGGEAIIRTLNLRSLVHPEFWIASKESAESAAGINWSTILFIAGMMVMVEGWRMLDFSSGYACAWQNGLNIWLRKFSLSSCLYRQFWPCSSIQSL